jgi:ABC-2 type transport system ATP-binding protein
MVKALDNISFSVKRRNRWFLGTEWSWKIYFNENTNDLYYADEGTALQHDVMISSKAVQLSIGYLPEHNPLYWIYMFVNI